MNFMEPILLSDKNVNLEVIYQTREALFHRDIQTRRRELKM